MNTRQEIAIGIALQTQVLKVCPIHNQLYCEEDQYSDDENMARAFAVAIELVNQHGPYAEEFHHDAHVLTDLLSSTIGAAPDCCPDCQPPRLADAARLTDPARLANPARLGNPARFAEPTRLSDLSSEVYAFR
jgi:hypothetical protein